MQSALELMRTHPRSPTVPHPEERRGPSIPWVTQMSATAGLDAVLTGLATELGQLQAMSPPKHAPSKTPAFLIAVRRRTPYSNQWYSRGAPSIVVQDFITTCVGLIRRPGCIAVPYVPSIGAAFHSEEFRFLTALLLHVPDLHNSRPRLAPYLQFAEFSKAFILVKHVDVNLRAFCKNSTAASEILWPTNQCRLHRDLHTVLLALCCTFHWVHRVHCVERRTGSSKKPRSVEHISSDLRARMAEE